MDDGCTSVLAEGQYTLACSLGIAQELQCHILVVLRSLGVGENLCHLLVVLAAQHELHIVECLLGKQCEGFLRYLEDCLSFKLTGAHAFL